MPQDQTSFAERLARIEKERGVPAPAPSIDVQSSPKPVVAPMRPKGNLGFSVMASGAAVVVVLCGALGAAFIFGSQDMKLQMLSVVTPGLGDVKQAEDNPTDRYEWDTKTTPFNAARLGMKRMNAFAEDMSDMEMDALVRQAQNLGQPFLANEIRARMGACETLKCRAALQSEYETQLAQLRRSTPNW